MDPWLDKVCLGLQHKLPNRVLRSLRNFQSICNFALLESITRQIYWPAHAINKRRKDKGFCKCKNSVTGQRNYPEYSRYVSITKTDLVKCVIHNYMRQVVNCVLNFVWVGHSMSAQTLWRSRTFSAHNVCTIWGEALGLDWAMMVKRSVRETKILVIFRREKEKICSNSIQSPSCTQSENGIAEKDLELDCRA